MKDLRAAFVLLVSALGVSLSSCSFLFGSLPGTAVEQPVIQHVPYNGSFTYTVDPGSAPHDVYFVFTNPDTVKDASRKPTVDGQIITVDGMSLPAPVAQPLYAESSAPTSLMDRIAEFNREPFGTLARSMSSNRIQPNIAARSASSDAQNDTDTFTYVYQVDNNTMTYNPINVPATCQLVRSNVDLGDGRKRSLSIWAADSATSLTAQMITALADKFLNPLATQDIYRWDTAVVGEPWGTHSNPQYIPWDANSTITILLCSLNTDISSPNGAVVGYFWSKDNMTTATYPGSNQRIMFYIDAELYASTVTGESSWAPTNYWPEEVYSTLAHEFQHMIQFYQKQIVYDQPNTGTDTWINEMCSMILEDLVADKMGLPGPRGVSSDTYPDGSAGASGNAEGRFPSFNQYSYYPLAQTTSFDLADYSTTYAFGAWLARNYGGTDLVKRIVQCAETDETSVTNAVEKASGRTGEGMTRLLEKWAAAVLLSDTTSSLPAGYVYNTGGWTSSTAGGITFNLGSINIFNYSPTLKVFTDTGSVPSDATFSHSSNVYYKAEAGLSASKTWSFTVPDGIITTVVLK